MLCSGSSARSSTGACRARRAKTSHSAPLGPSRAVVYRLAALFSLDAFAGGFIVQSLLALWLFQRFDLSLSAAASFFFWSSVLSAFSYPVAARLAKRVGLVNTMVYTHIPSSICLILAAFAPNLRGARPAAGPLGAVADGRADPHLLRHGGGDAGRADGGGERDRGAAQPRVVDQPGFRGVLLTTPFSGLPLVICGALKIVYDLSLLWSFRHIKPPEETKLARRRATITPSAKATASDRSGASRANRRNASSTGLGFGINSAPMSSLMALIALAAR